MRVFIAAGEVSGDVAGALLAQALTECDERIELSGIGGGRMAAAGVDVGAATNHLGTVGVSEALVALPSLWRVFSTVRCLVAEEPPNVAVLIGNDVFNVALARWLRMRGVPTVSYFPPQVWIWGALAGFTASCFDTILTCFPKEQEVYGAAAACGTRVVFVGHYLADQLQPATPSDREAARRRCGVPSGATTVALLPGSRILEVEVLAPILIEAAHLMLKTNPEIQFLLPLAEPDLGPIVTSAIDRFDIADHVVIGSTSLDVMRACDLVITASGTASLEAALLGTPMVIVYRVSAFTYNIVLTAIRLGLMESDTAGLPNLILGRPVVREHKQVDATPESVAARALLILNDPARVTEMVSALRLVGDHLRVDAGLERAVDAILATARSFTHGG